MCGRYYRRSDKQYIAEHFHLRDDLTGIILPDFDHNIAPTTHQPVIREARETGEREMVMMRWGLVPHFARSIADFKSFSTINARAENIQKAAMWRIPFQRRRCLVPANGFYEWKKLDARTKQPYAFALKDEKPFAFAGLWDYWKDAAGNWLQSFAIVTTDANPLVGSVHNRMPVIVPPAGYTRWLACNTADRDDVAGGELPTDLLRSFDAEAMQSSACNAPIGNVRNNDPAMVAPRLMPDLLFPQ